MGGSDRKRKRRDSESYSDSRDRSPSPKRSRHKHKSKHKHKRKDKGKGKDKDKDKKKKKKGKMAVTLPDAPAPVDVEKKYGKDAKITDDDYFARAAEFRVWLREKKGLFLSDLPSKKSHKLFSKFVDDWNSGILNPQYYTGLSKTDAESGARTNHSWGFQLNDQEMLVVDRVATKNTDTVRDTDAFTEITRKQGKRGFARGTPVASSNSARVAALPLDDDEYEKMKLAQRAAARASAKKSRDRENELLDELVPKETGRERMIQKKREKAARIHGASRGGLSPERSDFDVMGGGDDFRRATKPSRREEERMRNRMKKDAALADKRAAYDAKEKATMDAFKRSVGLL